MSTKFLSKSLSATYLVALSTALLLSACNGETSLSASSPATEDTRQDTRKAENFLARGVLAKSLPELSKALENGDITSEALVTDYLNRIAAIDRSGPQLRSIIALNPDALDHAKESDVRRADGETLGPLDGLPILLKDNIETKDPVATTAGAEALKNNITNRDAPLTAGLRAGGAIILGKTNLSQWANFRSNESISGWSAMGGQVKNPHILNRSPCGSSSGSGAAIAASLAAGAVGTETNGSVICPSNVNGIVGFKPTVGLVSQQYIVPISVSQDTAGPMTKTVRGAAMMLTAMATDGKGTDFTSDLSKNALSGKRVGVMRFSEGENADILERFNAALSVLEAQGAELVDIDTFSPKAENFWGKALDVLKYEYKDGLNHYLANAAPAVTARSMTDVIAYNVKNPDRELALFDQDLLESSEEKGPLTEATYLTALKDVQSATRENGIDALLKENGVDMLVSPSGPLTPAIDPVNGDVWPAWSGAGYLAAVAGYPHITVPMGAVHGVPIGFSIMGAKDKDAEILAYGYAYEQESLMRVDPRYLKSIQDRPEIRAAISAP